MSPDIMSLVPSRENVGNIVGIDLSMKVPVLVDRRPKMPHTSMKEPVSVDRSA